MDEGYEPRGDLKDQDNCGAGVFGTARRSASREWVISWHSDGCLSAIRLRRISYGLSLLPRLKVASLKGPADELPRSAPFDFCW